MNSDDKSSKDPSRVVLASRAVKGVVMGKVEVLASTKHGSTLLIGVKPPAELETGDELTTNAWILGSRNFVVLGKHDREMKLPGTWYVVRATKAKT